MNFIRKDYSRKTNNLIKKGAYVDGQHEKSQEAQL